MGSLKPMFCALYFLDLATHNLLGYYLQCIVYVNYNMVWQPRVPWPRLGARGRGPAQCQFSACPQARAGPTANLSIIMQRQSGRPAGGRGPGERATVTQ